MLDLPLSALWRRWPDNDPIQIIATAPALTPGFLRVEAIADCGDGPRRFYVDLPLYLLADEDTLITAARAYLRLAQNELIAARQAMVLEA